MFLTQIMWKYQKQKQCDKQKAKKIIGFIATNRNKLRLL